MDATLTQILSALYEAHARIAQLEAKVAALEAAQDATTKEPDAA